MKVAVPRDWVGQTAVVMATGPSLTPADVDACRGLRVIAVNDAYRLAPWADALYASDVSWWLVHRGVPDFAGVKWSVQHNQWKPDRCARFADVRRLAHAGERGLSTDPAAICTGRNSGYAALNLAVLYGATRIILLGFDMGHDKGGQTHFFGNHPGSLSNKSPYHSFLPFFKTAAAQCRALGVVVVNSSRRSSLDCFPKVRLEDALAQVAA